MKRFPISFSFLCNVFSHYFSSSSTCTCHDQQQFCLRTTFNVLVIPSQSAHRGGGPCGSPARQHGNRLCLMFQTGALGRTGGSARPSATGHLTVFYSTRFFLSRGRIKKKSMEVWRCRSVCALQCRYPQENFLCSFWSPDRGVAGLLCCVWTAPGALISAGSHRCPAAFRSHNGHHPSQSQSGSYWKAIRTVAQCSLRTKVWPQLENVLNCFHLFNKVFPLCFSRSCRGLCDFQEAGLLNGISSWAN